MAKQEKKQEKGSMENKMKQFFIKILKEIYWVEEKLIKTLPEMEEAASTENLQEAFEDHFLQTNKQLSRLKKIFKYIGETPKGEKNKAFDAIVEEGQEWIKNTEKGSMLRDAMLIFSDQKVEHFEIATYGTLVAMAYTLGMDKEADILNYTLEEEEETDKLLTEIAEYDIN